MTALREAWGDKYLGYMVLVRVAIVLAFVFVGVAAFAPEHRGAMVRVGEYIDPRWYGVVMFVCAALVLHATLQLNRLPLFAILPWFLYVGAVFSYLWTVPPVPIQTVGVYTLSSIVIIVEAVAVRGFKPHGG